MYDLNTQSIEKYIWAIMGSFKNLFGTQADF